MKTKVLGYTAVDSGQLMIMDPSYVKGHWKLDDDSINIVGVKYWGEAGDNVTNMLADGGLSVETRYGGARLVYLTDREEAEKLMLDIEDYANSLGKKIITALHTDSSYDRIGEVTLTEDKGGQLAFNGGHPGLGVAFLSGYGDGMYEVTAHYINDDVFGERIAKVEIVLIPEEGQGDDSDS